MKIVELNYMYFIFPKRRGNIYLLWDKMGTMRIKNIFFLGWDPQFIFSEKCLCMCIFSIYQYSGFLSLLS